MKSAALIVLLAMLSGCAAASTGVRAIHESNGLTVRLQPTSHCEAVVDRRALSHPIQLSTEDLRALLASLTARQKVGLLSSFTAAPGTPRLFDPREVEILAPALREAFAAATPDEVVIVLRERALAGSRAEMTTAALSIQENAFSVELVNFRHPVRTVASDVGSTDRLGDVKETVRYVQASPCTPVGEQDFAIFFDHAQFQFETRSGSLIRYPERALAIDYRRFLSSHDEPISQEFSTNPDALPSSPGSEQATIAELKRRIAELEQRQPGQPQAPTGGPLLGGTPGHLSSDQRDTPASPDRDRQAALADLVKRLESRIADLERKLQQQPTR